MSNTPPVWPRRWEDGYRRTRSVVLIGGPVLAVFFAGIGVLLLSAGLPGASAVAFALLVVFVLLIVAGAPVTIASRGRDASRTRQLRLRSDDRVVYLPFASGAGLGYIGLSLIVGLFLLSAPYWIELLPTTGRLADIRLRNWAPFLPVMGAIALSLPLARLVRIRSHLGLGLSSEGLYNWSWYGASFFPWDSIRQVRAHHDRTMLITLDVREPGRRTSNPEENWVGKLGFYRRWRTTLHTGFLAVNPAIAYYALSFYHRHPELREELDTEKAVDRIRNLDLPDVYDEVRRYGDVKQPS